MKIFKRIRCWYRGNHDRRYIPFGVNCEWECRLCGKCGWWRS